MDGHIGGVQIFKHSADIKLLAFVSLTLLLSVIYDEWMHGRCDEWDDMGYLAKLTNFFISLLRYLFLLARAS